MKYFLNLFLILWVWVFLTGVGFISFFAKKKQPVAPVTQTQSKTESKKESKKKSSQAEKEKSEQQKSSVLIQGKHVSSINIQPAKKWDISGGVEKKSKQKKQSIFVLKNQSEVSIKTPPQSLFIIMESVGQITVKNLKNTHLHISVKTGNVAITHSQGSFQVSVDNGQVELTNNKGKLEVHSYLAPIRMAQFDGSVVVRSYSGEVKIETSKGPMDVKSFSSPLSFLNTNGSLRFDGEKSPIKLRNHAGDVQGYSHKGSVTGSFIPSQAKIETGSGDIRLYFKSSKARVEAQSWEGKVLAPKYFYKDRAGGVYKAHGSMRDRGDVPGQVSLKSKTGKISIL